MRQKREDRPGNVKEKQGEFFGGFQASRPKKAGHSFRKDMMFGKKVVLNLSYENVVLLFIAFIMLLVIFFSLGVEKGEKEMPVAPNKSDDIIVDIGEIEEIAALQNIQVGEKKMIDVSPKPYTIQVASFKKEQDAEKVTGHLKNEGHEAFVISSNDWLQICVGRYKNKEESEKDLEILQKRYPTCYFRRIEKNN